MTTTENGNVYHDDGGWMLPLQPVGTVVEYYRNEQEGFSGVGTVVGHGTVHSDAHGETVYPVMLVSSLNFYEADGILVRVAWAVKERA